MKAQSDRQVQHSATPDLSGSLEGLIDSVTARLIKLLGSADDIDIIDTPTGAVLHQDTIGALAHLIASDGELVGRIVRREPARHQPRRGSDVADYIQAARDRYPSHSLRREALDHLLDDYRLRADYGKRLSDDVSGVA